MGEKVKEALNNCVVLLKGPSDEHKFAGLLILSKIFETTSLEGEEFVQLMHEVVSSVGVNFLIRLAKSEPQLTLNLLEKLSIVGTPLDPLTPLLEWTN